MRNIVLVGVALAGILLAAIVLVARRPQAPSVAPMPEAAVSTPSLEGASQSMQPDRSPVQPQSPELAVAIAAVDLTAIDDSVPPKGDLNKWPESKPLRRWLLRKAVADLQRTAGTSECFTHAHDIIVYGLGSIMDSQGRSEPLEPPFGARNSTEQFFCLNQRMYRPMVGEFPELDSFVKALDARDNRQRRMEIPFRNPADRGTSSDEISLELIQALEARAQEALRILED